MAAPRCLQLLGRGPGPLNLSRQCFHGSSWNAGASWRSIAPTGEWMRLCGQRHCGSLKGAATMSRGGSTQLRSIGTSWGAHGPQSIHARAFSGGPRADSGGAEQRPTGKPTHYDVLNVVPPSNQREIKMAYLRRAKHCHPDLHGDARTQEFQRLTAAYTVLSDDAKKADYDANGYQDYEDLSDREKVLYSLRKKRKEMFGEKTRGQIAWALVTMYVKVYLLLYVALFVMTLPLYLAGFALKVAALPFQWMLGE